MKSNIATVQTDSVIVSLMRASTALTEAKTIQQTKKILDVAAAAEIYAKRQHLGEEAMDIALSIKVEALRKLGEMLQATPKATGAKGLPGGGTRGSKKEPRVDDTPTLEELGLTKKESAVAQKLAALPEKEFEQVREGHVTVAKAIAAVNQTKPAAPAKVAPVEPPAADPEDEYTELDAAHDQIEGLQNMLAVANMGTVSEEDRDQAKNLIAELRAEIKTLRATLKAVTQSRDSLMNELSQVKRQCMAQQRELKSLKAADHA